jgi:ketosteroid isomerase-like protein
MTNRLQLRAALTALVIAFAVTFVPQKKASAAQPEQDVTFSANPAVSAQQHTIYDLIHRYEQMLNAGNTAEILKLYGPESIAEWNDKPTFKTRQQKIEAYDALFKIAKFTTVFSYDAIDVYGDTAIVRTHHHKGATVLENGKQAPDLNREVFVLHKIDGAWKIIFYAFNTNPIQGEE